MATLVRIKRRRNEEPSESIVIAPKRSKIEESGDGASAAEVVTVLRRVGTLKTEDESIDSHLNKALEQEKRAWARRKGFKKATELASITKLKENQKKETKSLSKAGRIKLVNARREGLDKVASLFDGIIQEDSQPSKDEDVITCNNVPMKSEKVEYVYDLYFTSLPVEHSSWMESICEFQHYSYLMHEDEIECHQDDFYDDEDDENDEGNWRNDYPDYPEEVEDEEDGNDDYVDYDEYMASIMQSAKTYDSDESYDVDDYEEAFNEDGSLVSTGGPYLDYILKCGIYKNNLRNSSPSSSDSDGHSDKMDSDEEHDSSDDE